MNKKIVNFEKISLYTESFGDSSKPAVLLIAGAMAPARCWIDEFCQQLADSKYFIIRYDHRDMGLSSAIDYVKNPYTLDNLVQDAIVILNAYAIKKAHIVGHSMGGAITQLIALDYPDRVLSITLISSAVLANYQLTVHEKENLEKTWQEFGRNKPTQKFAESVDGFIDSYTYLHGDIPVDQDIALDYIKDMYERSEPEHIAWFEKFSTGVEPMHNHIKAQLNISNRTQDLKNIKVPVLIIQGGKDPLVFERVVHDYCVKFIPHAKLEIISGMGHMILNCVLFAKIKDLIKKFIS